MKHLKKYISFKQLLIVCDLNYLFMSYQWNIWGVIFKEPQFIVYMQCRLRHILIKGIGHGKKAVIRITDWIGLTHGNQ